MNGLDLLVQMAWRGTIVLGAGAAAAYLLGRASAALRHYVWATVFCAALALPAVMMLAPKWSLRPAAAPEPSFVAPVRTAVPGNRTTVRVSVPAPRPLPNPLPWIYAAGAIAVAIRFIAGAVRTRRLLADATPAERFGIPRKVRVVESPHVPVPLVWGVLRPTIVLPAASRHWSAARLRTVLLHELIHVQRHDLLTQVLGQIACCLYWFHPLAWIAAREMRKERERACDDAVLRRGIAAPEYAGHLVDLVRGMAIAAPAMAEASGFEERVRVLLDRGQNRAPLTRGVMLAVAVMACLATLPMASITLHAQAAQGVLVGLVNDPSGARVPGATVVAKSLDGANEQTTKANEAGEFAFRAMVPGRYELQFRMPGFKMGRNEVVVVAGAVARADAFLELGEMAERIQVSGRKPAVPAAPTNARTPQRIPVGGSVQAARLLVQPRPVYPLELQQQGVAGTVMLRGIVGKDGRVLNPQVINTDIHPGLAQAALDAVRTWLYEPTRLNGQPVETLTKIDIAFELDK